MTWNRENAELPPACRETSALLQCVLDAELPQTVLDLDEHATACPACRGRIAAAKLLCAVLATPVEGVQLRPELAQDIVAAVQIDRDARRRIRRSSLAIGGGLAVAAAVLLGIWLGGESPKPLAGDTARRVESHPASTPAPTPPPQPVRLGDEFVKAEQAIIDTSRPLTDSAAVAPEMLAKITDVLTRPSDPAPEFEPARQSLLNLPDAARTGLEPVTATTQKAFARLLHDMGVVNR